MSTFHSNVRIARKASGVRTGGRKRSIYGILTGQENRHMQELSLATKGDGSAAPSPFFRCLCPCQDGCKPFFLATTILAQTTRLCLHACFSFRDLAASKSPTRKKSIPDWLPCAAQTQRYTISVRGGCLAGSIWVAGCEWSHLPDLGYCDSLTAAISLYRYSNLASSLAIFTQSDLGGMGYGRGCAL